MALTALTFMSSAISFSAYSLLLRFLGTSERVDLLFYASSVPIATAGVVSGVLLYFLPPNILTMTTERIEGTISALSMITALTVCIFILVAISACLVGHSTRFWLLWSGFTVVGGLNVLATLGLCLAQVKGKYLLTGIAPFIASIGLMTGVLLAIGSGIEWLLLVGQIVGTFLSILWLLSVLDFKPRLVFDLFTKAQPLLNFESSKNAISILCATLAFTVFPTIDAALCSRLTSGSMAIMSYAQKVVVAVGTAISLGAYTIAAKVSYDVLKSGGYNALRRQINREVFRIVTFGIVVFLGYVFGGKRILLLVISSTTMPSVEVSRLVQCISWILIGAGPMAAMPYLFRVFYCIHEYRTPAVIGISIACGYAGLAFTIMKYYGLLALPIAYTTVWWIAMSVALVVLNKPRHNLSEV